MEFIDLNAQQARIRPELDRRIAAVLDHGQYIMGPEVAELEERLATFTNAGFCIGVANGTDALLIALMALGIGGGDEVITPAFSFIAAAEVIELLGARPVFVDVDARSFNLDPALIQAAITPRTRAIVPVNLYGQCADYDAINAIAERHGLPVIEDAAQSLGATYKERQSCSLSTIACTSFFPSKPLGAYGDAGACFTADATLAERMRRIRVHGQDRRYHHPELGLNGRLDTLQAAILLAKLDIFADELVDRSAVAGRYDTLLGNCPGITLPLVEAHNRSTYAQYTVMVDDREAVRARLAENGVPTAVHYPVALTRQPVFSAHAINPAAFPRTEEASARVLSLPMHPYLDEATQDRIVDSLRDAVRAG